MLKNLITKYGYDNKFSVIPKKQKEFNHFRNMVPPIEDYNEMCDILYLPETKDVHKISIK